MTEQRRPVPYQPRIRDMPQGERPRERLRDHGPQFLSNAELLAILLGTGTSAENVVSMATRLLSAHNGLGGLARVGFQELARNRGMGEAKVAQVLAALEIGKRLGGLTTEDRRTIANPNDVSNMLSAEMSLLDQESLRVLLLNTRNQVVAIKEVYRGNVSSALVRVGEVFKHAVRENCPSIIVVHNHPSGDPTPSDEDARVTGQMVEAGRLLDIELLDHIVLAQRGHVSLKERGLGF